MPPTALLTVLTGPASGPALSGLMASTARPSEDLRILQAGTSTKTIVASDSPAPSPVVLPGRPLAPGGGADWTTRRHSMPSGRRPGRRSGPRISAAGAAQTRANTSAWLAGLDIRQKVSRLADPPADQGSLAVESAVAATERRA